MDASFTCHDIRPIQFRDAPERIHTKLVETFPSYVDAAGRSPDPHPVLVEFVSDLALPKGARYISSTAAYTDSSYYLFDSRGNLICIDLSESEEKYHCQVSTNIDWDLLEDLLEALLHVLAIERRKAFFHSGAIAVNGQAVLMCGWLNIGKTESVVEFLKRGYAYIGDDWTIIGADAQAYSYDKTITMYPRDIAVAPEVAQTCYGTINGKIIACYCRLCRPSKIDVELRPGQRLVQHLVSGTVRRLHLPTTIHPRADQITPKGTSLTAPLKVAYFMTRANVDTIAITPIQADELTARMLSCYQSETRLFIDPAPLKFAFPFRDFGAGLGLHLPDVKSIWSEALLHPRVQLFTAEIPVYARSEQLVSQLESHMHQCLE
jgi:hypothetical protein